jgi:hypothetical protein
MFFTLSSSSDQPVIVQYYNPNCPTSFNYIVTCKGLAWRIITGSGFDDWLYWHFFTITVNYNSWHIELLLNYVCLTNLYEESLTALNDVCLTNEFLNSLHGSLYRLACIHANPYKWFVVMKTCLPKRWLLSNRGSLLTALPSSWSYSVTVYLIHYGFTNFTYLSPEMYI